MADIRPFRAWRYNAKLGKNIENYTSPLFDVVTDGQLQSLYQNPHNSIHVSVPRHGSQLKPQQIIEQWKRDGIINLDMLPAIYIYYQHFNLPNEPKPLVRKGFICHVRATDWGQGPLMRHESTMPEAVKDRLQTLRDSKLQVNPTHGLYHDPNFSLEAIMDEAMLAPIYEVEDYQGVRDVIAIIHDAEAIAEFMKVMEAQKIVLADGHHRYEAAVAYKKECISKLHGVYTGAEPFNWHLMYLTNDANPDLRILATHRLIKGIGNWPKEEWRKRLEVFFDIKTLEDPSTLPEVISGKKHAFGLILPNACFKLRLKEGMLAHLDWAFPDEVKELDLTVLHYFVIWRILGISGPAQRKSAMLSYDRNFIRGLQKVNAGQADALFVTNPVTTAEVRQVAELGQTMPPKSTFFYPKVLGGFFFSSLHPVEFYSSVDALFASKGQVEEVQTQTNS